jgi:hypothetical protein
MEAPADVRKRRRCLPLISTRCRTATDGADRRRRGQAADKLEDARAELRAEMERRVAELGISAEDLFSTAGQQAPAEQAATKNGRRTRKPRDDIGVKRAAQIPRPERRRMVWPRPAAELAWRRWRRKAGTGKSS